MTKGRCEKPAGDRSREQPPGRDPSGDTRANYAEALEGLERGEEP